MKYKKLAMQMKKQTKEIREQLKGAMSFTEVNNLYYFITYAMCISSYVTEVNTL